MAKIFARSDLERAQVGFTRKMRTPIRATRGANRGSHRGSTKTIRDGVEYSF